MQEQRLAPIKAQTSSTLMTTALELSLLEDVVEQSFDRHSQAFHSLEKPQLSRAEHEAWA
jgi:hypothetical protein